MTEKRLMRSRSDCMFLGVAGGLAEYFEIDPVLMRLLFAAFGLASFGQALLLYVLLAILMPQQNKAAGKANPFDEEEIVIQESG